MGEFSLTHLLFFGVILLLFFGPSRLPGLGQSLGKAIRGFKEGLNETTNTSSDSQKNEQLHEAPSRTTDAQKVKDESSTKS